MDVLRTINFTLTNNQLNDYVNKVLILILFIFSSSVAAHSNEKNIQKFGKSKSAIYMIEVDSVKLIDGAKSHIEFTTITSLRKPKQLLDVLKDSSGQTWFASNLDDIDWSKENYNNENITSRLLFTLCLRVNSKQYTESDSLRYPGHQRKHHSEKNGYILKINANKSSLCAVWLTALSSGFFIDGLHRLSREVFLGKKTKFQISILRRMK